MSVIIPKAGLFGVWLNNDEENKKNFYKTVAENYGLHYLETANNKIKLFKKHNEFSNIESFKKFYDNNNHLISDSIDKEFYKKPMFFEIWNDGSCFSNLNMAEFEINNLVVCFFIFISELDEDFINSLTTNTTEEELKTYLKKTIKEKINSSQLQKLYSDFYSKIDCCCKYVSRINDLANAIKNCEKKFDSNKYISDNLKLTYYVNPSDTIFFNYYDIYDSKINNNSLNHKLWLNYSYYLNFINNFSKLETAKKFINKNLISAPIELKMLKNKTKQVINGVPYEYRFKKNIFSVDAAPGYNNFISFLNTFDLTIQKNNIFYFNLDSSYAITDENNIVLTEGKLYDIVNNINMSPLNSNHSNLSFNNYFIHCDYFNNTSNNTKYYELNIKPVKDNCKNFLYDKNIDCLLFNSSTIINDDKCLKTQLNTDKINFPSYTFFFNKHLVCNKYDILLLEKINSTFLKFKKTFLLYLLT
jgi:hypothetical protein